MKVLQVFSADGFIISAVLSAVQAAILSTRLPKVEYLGNFIIKSDSVNYDDIQLKFDISKLQIKPWEKNDKKNFLILNDFLVHVSFLLYFDTKLKKCSEKVNFNNNLFKLCFFLFLILLINKIAHLILIIKIFQYQILCDPPLDLRNLISNRCDITIGKDGNIYSMTINGKNELKEPFFDEILRITKRRHASVLKAMENSQKNLQHIFVIFEKSIKF